MDDTSEFFTDDELAKGPLESLGWRLDWVSWRDTSARWDDYDRVVIRTPWDYQDEPQAFLDTLTAIDRSSAELHNPLSLVRWNLDKRYLLELASRGAPVIPTRLLDGIRAVPWPGLFEQMQSDHLVLKPLVGANADDVLPIRPDDRNDAMALFSDRPCLVQPFVDSVVVEGEFSLIYFRGQFSHCLLKSPASGDFRVQEEHGASLQPIHPDASLLGRANEIVETLALVPLYLRVDLVRGPAEDCWWLMELELIEPSLYLRLDPEAPGRFAAAIANPGNVTAMAAVLK